MVIDRISPFGAPLAYKINWNALSTLKSIFWRNQEYSVHTQNCYYDDWMWCRWLVGVLACCVVARKAIGRQAPQIIWVWDGWRWWSGWDFDAWKLFDSNDKVFMAPLGIAENSNWAVGAGITHAVVPGNCFPTWQQHCGVHSFLLVTMVDRRHTQLPVTTTTTTSTKMCICVGAAQPMRRRNHRFHRWIRPHEPRTSMPIDQHINAHW